LVADLGEVGNHGGALGSVFEERLERGYEVRGGEAVL
jgi:hypothetical protein